MIGAFIGDIVGSAYEFHNTKDYNFEIFKAGSSYTDDSIMTVAVARWLLEDPGQTQDSLKRIMEEQGRKYPHPAGGYGCLFQCWLHAANKVPYNSWGNGSAMRVSPVGWAFDTLAETERVAELSASVTHNHPEGIKGAQATAAAIWMARHGSTREEIRSYIETRFGYDLSRSWDYLHDTYGWEDSCQKTVPEAIIAFLDSTDFEDAIRKAVSMGGDSDTIGAITGSIAEAFYGGVPGWMRTKAEEIFPEGAGEFLKDFMTWASGRA